MGKRKNIAERIASSKIVKAGVSIALAFSMCASPLSAFAAGEDAGGWSLNIHSYDIEGGVGSVNSGVGYLTEDGEITYCYDWESHGPSGGQDYTHMKRGSSVTDFIVAKGYPNTTEIAGHELGKAEAQAATQLAAWVASGTMKGGIEGAYGDAPAAVKQAANDLCEAAEAYKGGDDRIDGASCILFVNGKKEVQPMLLGNRFGHISLTKVSSNTDITGGNGLYGLDGVEYGVFTDKACTQSYHGYRLTLDKKHNAGLDMVPGTYYVKEVTAPASGTYALDQTVYEVKVKSAQTAVVNGGSVSDVPQSNPLRIVLVKHDSESQDNQPQGDGAMAGAEFTVKYYDNDQGSTEGKATRTWVLATDSAREVLLDGDHLVSGTLYSSSKGEPTLPIGTYSIQETKAPEGYLVNDEVHVMQVRDTDGRDGASETVESYVQVSNLKLDQDGSPLTEDDVVRGGVRVTKADLELGKSEALGGDSHGTLPTGTTLSGIEFTITNQSKAKVQVQGAWYEPGQTIETIATAWDDKLAAYIAQTAPDELPYGTYAIQETKTSDSYLLTDGEPKTFQIREDGMVVTATSEGGELTFYDQVVRNDLKLSKKADATSESLQVPFAIENAATGETHVLVTDRNGQGSTASSWNKHTADTNGNDGLLGHVGAIAADDMNSKAGIWFALGEDGSEAPANDSLAALPYGEYTLTELRCEANKGYELISKRFWIERDSGTAEAVWMTLDDQEGPSVRTEATDGADGDHTAQCAGEVTIVDTVSYENLQAGKEYTLDGALMVKSTGKALQAADGSPVTASKTFIPAASSGTVDVEFTFDGSLLAGEDVVAFESLVREGIEVAAHADIDDAPQTVHFLGISTTATDKADGDKLVTGERVTLTDAVALEGLAEGEVYKLVATLMDADTGEALKAGGPLGGDVTGELEFTAEASDCTQGVEVSFDSTGLGGHRLVVFEKLLAGDGTVLATHEDLGDEGQSVTVCEIGTTLTDAADGDHAIATGKVKLTDAVEYKGLIPGQTYTMNGQLMLKASGEGLEVDGKPITAKVEFAPEKPDGTVEVAFEFDASGLHEGDYLVAFEECLDAGGNLVASHVDIDDEGQTVAVDNPETPETPETPGTTLDKTGVNLAPYAAGATAALVAAAGLTIYAIRKRREPGDSKATDKEQK